jgi:hypothetical protein
MDGSVCSGGFTMNTGQPETSGGESPPLPPDDAQQAPWASQHGMPQYTQQYQQYSYPQQPYFHHQQQQAYGQAPQQQYPQQPTPQWPQQAALHWPDVTANSVQPYQQHNISTAAPNAQQQQHPAPPWQQQADRQHPHPMWPQGAAANGQAVWNAPAADLHAMWQQQQQATGWAAAQQQTPQANVARPGSEGYAHATAAHSGTYAQASYPYYDPSNSFYPQYATPSPSSYYPTPAPYDPEAAVNHPCPAATAALPVAMQAKTATAPPQQCIDAASLFLYPGRASRPRSFVVIVRGIPGSGKSWLAQRLRRAEVEAGAQPARILSIDPYFLSEVEEGGDGGRGPLREEYRHDFAMEGARLWTHPRVNNLPGHCIQPTLNFWEAA